MKAYFNNVIVGDNVMDIILGIGKVHEVRGTGKDTKVCVVYWIDKPSFKGLTPTLRHLCIYDVNGLCEVIGSTTLTNVKSQTLFYNKDILTSELDMSDVEDNEIITNKDVYKNLELELLEVKAKSGVWLDSKFIYPNLLEDMLSDLDSYSFRKTTGKKRHGKVWNKDYTNIEIEVD